MSLRAKIVLYLVLIHLALGGVAIFVLAQNRALLIAVELFFVVSIALGALFVRSFFVPLGMIRTGAELIQEQDFTAHFREVGQREMDELIRIYNRMIDRLREERLKAREQHHFLERVLQASPAGVVTLDFDGCLSQLNPSACRLLEVEARSTVGRPLAELEHPLLQELGALPVGESRVVGGPWRRLKISRAAFYDRGFARSFFLVEELTEELRRSEKAAYEKVVRILSHEVNNSVGAVSSLLDSARSHTDRPGGDGAELRSALDVAIGRMQRLNAFMQSFADVVRLPAPELRPCDLEALLDDILILLRPELERRRILCTWAEKSAVPPIAMDKNQIEQVLVNVLKNAMEAIGEAGRITLSLGEERGRPRLSVADTGSGLSPDVRSQLFTPFFSTKRDGRGLGLTVVREILAQHRFEFDLKPRREGGSEFRIRFGD